MTQESSTIKCKNCGTTCVRLLAGYYPDNINKRWVDHEGREFNGRLCPSCHAEKQAKLKQKKKSNSYV